MERKCLCRRYKPGLAVDGAAVISSTKMLLLAPVLLGCCMALSEYMNPSGQLFSASQSWKKGGKWGKAEWQHVPVAGDPPDELRLVLMKGK